MLRLTLAAALLLPACSSPTPLSPRPATWATPVSLPGVPNLHRLSPDLYRSTQPTAEGMRHLKAAGIKTVINLRAFHDDGDELAGTSLAPVHIPILTWSPKTAQAYEFFDTLSDPRNLPALVHCQHGADRTGALCALYRIHCQNWSPAEAIRELRYGGYGYHSIWKNIPPWVTALPKPAVPGLQPIPTTQNPDES